MPASADLFARNLGALSAEQQQRLGQCSAAVVGCGGLGGYVIEALVRIGVGGLRLFDPDVFTSSNRNRQLNALERTLGRNKAETAAERAAAIHDRTVVRAIATDFRTEEEAFATVDVVIDCLDDIQARRDLAGVCRRFDLPLVHGAVKDWYGQVGVQLPGNDLLALLYPERTGRPRQEPLPVLSFTVTAVASLQAAEAVKLLLGLPSPLHNSWMHLDLKQCEFLLAG